MSPLNTLTRTAPPIGSDHPSDKPFVREQSFFYFLPSPMVLKNPNGLKTFPWRGDGYSLRIQNNNTGG
jgi:hypothetical protein